MSKQLEMPLFLQEAAAELSNCEDFYVLFPPCKKQTSLKALGFHLLTKKSVLNQSYGRHLQNRRFLLSNFVVKMESG